MKENNTYSVYMHKNKTNNKVYIGMTSKQNPEERWKKGNGYWANKYFHNSILKYGWDGFEHVVIESNLTKSEAEEMEIKLIKEYDSTKLQKGYNIQNGGNSVGQHNEETKRKISEIQYKPLYQYNRFTGEFIKRFKSTLDAEIKLGIPNPDISAVCLKKVKTAHNFVFRYESDDNVEYGKSLSKDEINYINTNNCTRKIIQYDLSGNYINKFNKISDATIITGVSKTSILSCLSGKSKIGGKYIWRYLESVSEKKLQHIDICFNIENSLKGRPKVVKIYNMEDKLIKECKTSKEASIFIGVTPGAITYSMKNCNGKIKNYICKYA